MSKKKRVEKYPRETCSFCKVVPKKQSLKLCLISFNYVGFKICFRCCSRIFESCQKCLVVRWFLVLNLNFHFTDRDFHQENSRLVLSSYRDCANLILKFNSH
jgi:hypothetical protein